MSNEVALVDNDTMAMQKFDDSVFDKLASGKYLPRIQLMTSSSGPCKSGEFPVNHYAFYKSKNPIDLTTEVDVLVLSWRPKAIRMGDAIITVHDVNDPEFQKIMEESDTKDSGCMFGPEYLCYVPSMQEFATFFMGSKSARNESANVKALMGKAATLRSQKIQTKKYTWQAPQVVPCSTPFELPAVEEIQKQVQSFQNPPVSEIETVDADETARAR